MLIRGPVSIITVQSRNKSTFSGSIANANFGKIVKENMTFYILREL